MLPVFELKHGEQTHSSRAPINFNQLGIREMIILDWAGQQQQQQQQHNNTSKNSNTNTLDSLAAASTNIVAHLMDCQYIASK